MNNVLNDKLNFSHFLFTAHCAMPEDMHRIYFPSLSRNSAPGRVFYIPFTPLPALAPLDIFSLQSLVCILSRNLTGRKTPQWEARQVFHFYFMFGKMRTKRSICWEFDLQCQHRISVALVYIVGPSTMKSNTSYSVYSEISLLAFGGWVLVWEAKPGRCVFHGCYKSLQNSLLTFPRISVCQHHWIGLTLSSLPSFLGTQ